MSAKENDFILSGGLQKVFGKILGTLYAREDKGDRQNKNFLLIPTFISG